MSLASELTNMHNPLHTHIYRLQNNNEIIFKREREVGSWMQWNQYGKSCT